MATAAAASLSLSLRPAPASGLAGPRLVASPSAAPRAPLLLSKRNIVPCKKSSPVVRSRAEDDLELLRDRAQEDAERVEGVVRGQGLVERLQDTAVVGREKAEGALEGAREKAEETRDFVGKKVKDVWDNVSGKGKHEFQGCPLPDWASVLAQAGATLVLMGAVFLVQAGQCEAEPVLLDGPKPGSAWETLGRVAGSLQQSSAPQAQPSATVALADASSVEDADAAPGGPLQEFQKKAGNLSRTYGEKNKEIAGNVQNKVVRAAEKISQQVQQPFRGLTDAPSGSSGKSKEEGFAEGAKGPFASASFGGGAGISSVKGPTYTVARGFWENLGLGGRQKLSDVDASIDRGAGNVLQKPDIVKEDAVQTVKEIVMNVSQDVPKAGEDLKNLKESATGVNKVAKGPFAFAGFGEEAKSVVGDADRLGNTLQRSTGEVLDFLKVKTGGTEDAGPQRLATEPGAGAVRTSLSKAADSTERGSYESAGNLAMEERKAGTPSGGFEQGRLQEQEREGKIL